MGILSPNDFKRRFTEALPGSDQNLVAFLQDYGQAVQTILKAKGSYTGPNTITGELVKPADGLTGEIVQSTGINSKLLMSFEGSADEARDGKFHLSPHQCSSCMAPQDVPKQYDCSDLTDPYQVRGGQLMRMSVGLHELGHTLYEMGKLEANTLTTDQFYHINSNPHVASETHADLFMGITLIAQLGPEAVAYLKQYADGMRGESAATGKRHDTINSLALLIEKAEKDPAFFAALTPDRYNATALQLTAEFMPSEYQSSVVYGALHKDGVRVFNHELEGVQRGGQRLEWYDEKMKQKEENKPVNLSALAAYDKYYRKGDQLMMFAEDWEANQKKMLDLSPLSTSATWKAEAEEKEKICRAQPAAKAPKPE